MKIIFAGTPLFSVSYLKCILQTDNEVVGVITQSDKPKGRGYKISPSPVKDFALSYSLPVYEIEKFDEGEVEKIKNLHPDLIIIVAFGKILPADFINIPKLGCINVHFSLLPKLRGAAPVPWAIIQGEKITGVSIMFIVKELDAGEIILQKEIEIKEEDNAKTLLDKLSAEGISLLNKTIYMFSQGKIISEPQKGEITWAPQIKKDTAKINWNFSSFKINCQIRGLNPNPGAFTYFRGKMCKIWKAKIIEDNKNYSPGEIIEINKEIKIGTGEGILLPQEIQLEGRKKLTTGEFISGSRPKIGEKFSSLI